MNSYELSRNFFDWCFENPEKVNVNHIAIYFFAIEHCNRLGWKTKFGFPSQMTMEALGIKSYNTYIKAFNDLVEFGFIDLVEKSRNQYSANIIALSNFNKATNKALDKAFIKHTTKQSESTYQSTSESNYSINKQITIEPFNQKQLNKEQEPLAKFNFKNSMLEYGFNENLVNDWLLVRKNKKATNSQTAFKNFISEIEKKSCDINEMLKIAVANSWSGFKHDWVKKQNNQNTTENLINSNFKPRFTE
jgi:hypothetical protein